MSDILTSEEVMEMFRESGALLQGHFLLASGRHSDRYFEKALALKRPQNVERMCRELARRFEDERPEVVIGPTTLGVVLAYECAKHLGVESVFAERSEAGGRELRRGFRLKAGQRVLVVDDILTTGGSVKDVLDMVHEWGATPIGVGVLVDRAAGTNDFGVRLESLLQLDVPTYEEAECPLCASGVELVKPGSTPKPGQAKGSETS